ncbi:MAG: ABC-2 family transporter protein [Candidatus Poribacteria bacterium]|nr:ABC-2 family transporter protein [Candidatus Poribacteria bacterium]MDE0505454.1 ABC-2 family transporter protein [Candidatus Poribacteria bacterium]
MRKYLAFSAKAFQRTLTYRFELWMELAINVLFMLIYVYLWKALYTDQTSVEGYDLNGILTYIVISQSLLTFVFTLRISRTIQAKIRAGEVATDLMKPIDFQMMTLATAVGTSLHTLLFNMLPKVVLFYVIFKLSLPPSFLTAALFIVSAVLGYVILFGIEFIIGVLAFWLIEIYGIYALVIWGLHMLFSGYFLPLEFYPAFLSKVAEVLPFRAIIYIPTALYTGNLAGSDLSTALLVQLAWATVLMALGRISYRAAFRKLVVQGG